MKLLLTFLLLTLPNLANASDVTINGKKTNFQNLNLITKTLEGREFNLEKMRGKVVLVNFWAQWCQNCLKEMLILEELYHEHHVAGLEIIGVSVDPEKSRPHVLKRAAKVTYQNSMLIDAQVSDFSEVDFIPTNYIFDREGKLQMIDASNKEGHLSKKYLEELLKTLLKKKVIN
jgi:thiol-disulfide isomerase/thioredoxin